MLRTGTLAFFALALSLGRAPAALAGSMQDSFASAVAQARPAQGRAAGQGAAPAVDPEAFLPLREALVLALGHNLDIELARIEPELAAQGVAQAQGAFAPLASLGLGVGHDEIPQASSFERGGEATSSDGWNYKGGFSGVLPFGLRYSSGYTLGRTETDSQQTLLAREFRSRWLSEVTLPLLRDFRMNEARVRVVRSELGQELSQDVFAARLSELLAGVETLYWDVAATRAEVNVAAKSLRTAQDLLARTRIQEELGVVPRVAVTQASAGVAERELAAIRAENAASAARDRLLQAILVPSPAAYRDRDLIPEIPTFSEYRVDLERSIASALEHRPELSEARRRVQGAQVEQGLARNQMRPRLDLVATYSFNGLAGKSKRLRDTFGGLGCGAAPADRDPALTDALCNGPASPTSGGGLDASDDFFRAGGKRSYSVGAQFEVPLGNQSGRAVAAQRAIEARRAKTQLRKLEQDVIVGVRQAVRELESAAKAVRAAQRRRDAVVQTLEAEQDRLDLGESTPFQVLEFEAQVADAERQRIDALRDHRNAITRLEQAQGSLLVARGIDLDAELAR